MKIMNRCGHASANVYLSKLNFYKYQYFLISLDNKEPRRKKSETLSWGIYLL